MKKIGLLLVGAIGFLLGSRLGRGPYQAVEASLRRVIRQPGLQSVKENVAEETHVLLDAAADKVRDAGAAVGAKISPTKAS